MRHGLIGRRLRIVWWQHGHRDIDHHWQDRHNSRFFVRHKHFGYGWDWRYTVAHHPAAYRHNRLQGIRLYEKRCGVPVHAFKCPRHGKCRREYRYRFTAPYNVHGHGVICRRFDRAYGTEGVWPWQAAAVANIFWFWPEGLLFWI